VDLQAGIPLSERPVAELRAMAVQYGQHGCDGHNRTGHGHQCAQASEVTYAVEATNYSRQE
jgi:hypothetical protein